MELNETVTGKTESETQAIRRLIQCGKLDEASDICIHAMQNGYLDKELYIFFILFVIRLREQAAGQADIFHVSEDPDVLINHYRALKFFVRRQEFPQMEARQDELYSYCAETNTSMIALETIAEYSTCNADVVIEKIRKGLICHE